ncbi:tape measure protein [Leuconostoc citreum]|uniref:tape measure protein n=1 Tax=Leuconostoc citreum TaxID=33964 RepID=UPI0021A53814|nr:tape measure protein [Leuconostoc citreum]MCT3076668.1 CHAP domain-containing protein [Leuconostoc citreum]
MAKQIVNEMATNLTLDSKSAAAAIKQLTQEVKSASAESKIMENQYKAAGDTLNASKAKYEGLQTTIEKQKAKVDDLKQALENNNTETKKGQDLQVYLTNELARSERQYASYQGQLDKATQAYKYQESGLAELNKELKHGTDMTDARVKALEAEGKSEEANKVKLEGLKDTQENYTKQLKIQQDELKSLSETGDKSSDSYKRQALRVEQMGAKLAETTRDIKNFNKTDIKPEVSGISKVRQQLHDLDDALEGTRSRFKAVFLGNLAANGVINAFQSIKSKISETFEQAKEYNKEQQVMNATWTTLTDSADKGKEMVKSINQISTAFGQSNDVVNELSQQFYHVFNQKEPTDQLTKSMLTMADTLGMNSEQVERLGLNFTHMMSSTKLQLGDFNMITDQLPMYGEKLLEYEQKVQKNSKLTMDQLRKQMSDGKISAKDATEVMNELGDKYKSASENMMGTASGMERVIEARGKALAGALIQPIMNAQNPIFGAISKWVSDPKTEQEFDKVGNSISKSFGTVTSAFGKEFKSSDFTGGMDKFMDNLAKSIEKFGDYVAKHKDDIIGFFKGIKALGDLGFSSLGSTLKIVLPLLEQLGKFAEKHPTTFKILAGSIIGLNLALKGTLATMATFDRLKLGFNALSGLIIKPRVEGGPAKRELGIISKMAVGIGKGVVWTAKMAVKTVLKSLELIGGAVIGIGKGLWWTAKLAAKTVFKTLELIGDAVIGIGKGLVWTAKLAWTGVKKAFGLIKIGAVAVGKGMKWTASVATKGAQIALKGLLATAKVTGNGIKLAFNFMKANPLVLLVTAITAVIVGLVELYKHNKKFKAFVDGMAKVAGDFFKGIGKWISQAWNTTKKIFGQVVNFFKKDWKEILLLIVNPFAGAFALLYKHNDNFKKSVDNLVKTVINFCKSLLKDITNIFNSIVKFIANTLKTIWNNWINIFKSIYNFVVDTFNSIFKSVNNIFNSIKDFIANTLNSIWKTWANIWKTISNVFGNTWKWLKKTGSDAINSVHDTISGVLDKIVSVFSNAWKSVKSGFNDLWDGMKKLAADGINMVIHPINSGIGGINDIIHDFGGPKNTIGKIKEVKFATGTGAFSGERKPITKPTLALLNDGVDSPETGNKEALVHPNGQMEIVQGNNVNRWLAPGTEVLNAKELAMIMGYTPYASGTGFFGSIWDGLKGAGSWVGKVAGNAWDGMKDGAEKFTKMLGYITDAVAHPIESLTKKFNPKTNGGFGTLFNAFGDGAFGKATDSVKGWWSELWGMAKGASDSGDTGGQGDNYPWKSVGKDSGADPWGYFYRECVSYVANSLKNMGVSTSLFSGLGNGSDWVNAPVRHTNDPKPGMVAVYGPGSEFGNHVAMVRGVKGSTFSGEEYNWGGDGNYHTYSGRSKSGVTTFLDFGKSGGGEEGVEANNPLQKLIKSQVGGMFDWIQKFIGPVNDTSTGVGGDVQSWSNDVKNALAKLGLSTAPDMIQRVLRQIQTESGGNPKAMGGNDGLADGNATGLMQVKPGTFAANMLPGHGNIMNGYDNILAGLNYARKRYGDGLSFLGNGHGYANGGLITKHQIAEIGEGNKPEMIIPLDGMKSSRGFELLGKTAVAMAARDGRNQEMGQSEDVSVLSVKFDKMISLLGQLVKGQNEPTPAYMVAGQAQSELDKLKQQRNTLNLLAKG